MTPWIHHKDQSNLHSNAIANAIDRDPASGAAGCNRIARLTLDLSRCYLNVGRVQFSALTVPLTRRKNLRLTSLPRARLAHFNLRFLISRWEKWQENSSHFVQGIPPPSRTWYFALLFSLTEWSIERDSRVSICQRAASRDHNRGEL